MRPAPEKSEIPGVSPLIDERALAKRVAEMAADIAAQCAGVGGIVLVGLLKGVFVFMADLVRVLSRHGVRPTVGFMTLESYGSGKNSSGAIQLKRGLDVDVSGRTVVLLDDILDTGHSLAFARRKLEEAGAARVITAVLLDKPSRREVPIEPDHVGFEIPDRFVVGYGIDYAGQHRELPYVGVVEEDQTGTSASPAPLRSDGLADGGESGRKRRDR
jgi:hypoxanthine phosphoribosyltransferase